MFVRKRGWFQNIRTNVMEFWKIFSSCPLPDVFTADRKNWRKSQTLSRLKLSLFQHLSTSEPASEGWLDCPRYSGEAFAKLQNTSWTLTNLKAYAGSKDDRRKCKSMKASPPPKRKDPMTILRFLIPVFTELSPTWIRRKNNALAS